ncbi:MAG: flagellar biosynthesis protein FlhB [Phycisphaerae bacterium]|nr:flagellar biosynthesis protein FlhB [Phycisphaerae bacterium]
MPEKPASERTEQPTPERLRKARREGRVAHSNEVNSALMITMLLVALGLSAPYLYQWFVQQTQQGCLLRFERPMNTESVSQLLRTRGSESFMAVLPFLLGGAAVSVLGSLLVSGWAFSTKALRLNPERISPVNGLKNLISLRSVVHLLVSVAKLTLIAAIVYHYLHDKLGECMAIRWASPTAMVVITAKLIFGVVARIAVGLLGIAGIDMLYQKWNHKRQLRMTRQEVKEERREHEPSPEVRGRIRAVQLEMARARMLQEVAEADVVLTNPTHVAVALRYDAASMEAPQVLAKGPDLLCEKIKEIARAHNVPILYRPELARTIYATVDVGQGIPEMLFVAVAEILAMIYRLRNRRTQQDMTQS